MFKCVCLISFKHGLLQTYSSRWIFRYKQFYFFSITLKTSTTPLDDVVMSHDLVRRIFIILWFTLIGWFWWHRGFCTNRESYRRPNSPRRSLSSWSWRVRTESGDLWRPPLPAPFGTKVPSCPLARGPGAVLLVRRGLVGSSSELTSCITLSSRCIMLNVWWHCRCWIELSWFICVFRGRRRQGYFT